MAQLIISALIGFLAGISSGFFGIGGGIIIVPALVAFAGFSQQKAQGTSLVALLMPVGILAVLNYSRSKAIDFGAGAALGVGLLGGAFFGSKFSLNLPSEDLKRWFGCFLVLIGIWMVLKK